MSTLGWSVSEKDTEWKLASDVTCRGEKLMLRAATVRDWQPHPGVPSRTCLATLLRVLMTGMLVPAVTRENQKRRRKVSNSTGISENRRVRRVLYFHH